MTNLQRLCPKCMKMIPSILNGMYFPCPELQGYSACKIGIQWLAEEQKLIEISFESSNHNLENYRNDSEYKRNKV